MTEEIKEENGKKVKYLYKQKIVEKVVHRKPSSGQTQQKSARQPLQISKQKHNPGTQMGSERGATPSQRTHRVQRGSERNSSKEWAQRSGSSTLRKKPYVEGKQSTDTRLMNPPKSAQNIPEIGSKLNSTRTVKLSQGEINATSRVVRDSSLKRTEPNKPNQPAKPIQSSLKSARRENSLKQKEKKSVKITETVEQKAAKYSKKTVQQPMSIQKEAKSLENYKSTPLTSKKIQNLVFSYEQSMVTYSHSSTFGNSIPIFQVRAIQPRMALTKYLWECYETKCMHFIDHKFPPVKKRSFFNKHTNERLEVVCDFEWRRVAILLEEMRREEAKKLKLQQDQEEEKQKLLDKAIEEEKKKSYPQRMSAYNAAMRQRDRKSLKDERENKFINPNPSQVIQGGLKNCYLLSALSSISKRNCLITRIIGNNEKNDFGLFSVWLNINGVWDEYVVDDYIPVAEDPNNINENGEPKKSPVFSKFGKFGEDALWVILIEKAYAKAFGGYQRIDLGDPTCALRDLTGAPVTRIDFAYVHHLYREVESLQKQIDQKCAKYQLYQQRDEKKEELETKVKEIWSLLMKSIRNGYIICCYTMNEEQTAASNQEFNSKQKNYDTNLPDGRDETFNQRVSKNGIVYNHAYSILNACSVEKKVKGKYHHGCGFEESWKILKLRNPWGKVEWKGAWGHGSTMWDIVRKGEIRVTEQGDLEMKTFEQRPVTLEEDARIKEENQVSENDGVFWMETTDFIKNFAGFSVCKVETDYVYTNLEFEPQPMLRDRKSPIQKNWLNVDIKEAGNYTLTVHQTDKMFFYGSKLDYHYKSVRMTILDLKRGSEEVKLIDCKFEQTRNLDIELEDLKVGSYIVMLDIYKTSHLEEDVKFVFSTYGPKKTELKFFVIPMTREQETGLALNPYYCTPTKISEKIFWMEFIRENLDGLFQHYHTFRLKQEDREVVEINYYEFTKLEEEEPNPYKYGRTKISEERKQMIQKQKKLMETYWKYGVEAIEKWTVEDIIYENTEQKEKEFIAQYSSNTVFDNKNADNEVTEEEVFDWANLTYENIEKMGDLREIMKYAKQRYDAGVKISEVVMIHLQNPIPFEDGSTRPHM